MIHSNKFLSVFAIIFFYVSCPALSQNGCVIPKNIDNRKELQKYGKCYISDKVNSALLKEYAIPEDMKKNDAGLIFLIIVSKSIDTKAEKQNWFNLYQMMEESKIERLYEILIKEYKRLSEIQANYDKKKDEIKKKYLEQWRVKTFVKLDDFNKNPIDHLIQNKKNIINSTFKFIGKCKDRPNFQNIWVLRPESDDLIESEGNAVCPCKNFEIFYPRTQETYTGIKKILLENYLNELFDLPIDFQSGSLIYNQNYLFSLPNFSTHYWLYAIRKSYSDREYKNLENLLNISVKEIIHTKNDVTKKEFDNNRNLYLSYYYYHMKNYLRSCECYSNVINTDYLDRSFQNIPSIILHLWKITVFLDDIKSKKCGEAALKALFTKYGSSIKSLKDVPGEIDTELMLIDYINIFNTNVEVKDIVNSYKNKITPNYSTGSNTFSSSWYTALNKKYHQREFRPNLSISEIKKEGGLLASSTGIGLSPNASESALLEYYTYYLLYCLKHNHINSLNYKNYLLIADAANEISNNIAYDAYAYIEKHIVKSIQNRLMDMYKPSVTAIAKTVHRNKFAIVVGISDYKNLSTQPTTYALAGELYDLKYASKDANDFVTYLETSEHSGGDWQIYKYVNSDATASNIKRKIQEVLISRVSSQDIVYLYFSGHGRTSDYNTSETYLLTYDFQKEDDYSGIEYHWLINQIQDSKAKHVILFVDACKSGMFGNKGNNTNEILYEQYETHKIIITSASDDQLSSEDDNLKNGVFTHFLIKGLKGDAPEYSDTDHVNLNEIRDYLRVKVSEYRKKQVPNVVGRITNENFPLSIRN